MWIAGVISERWVYNERYHPTPQEVFQWMDYIKRRSTVVSDPLFYIAMIEIESGGDSTSNPKIDSHRTFGLGNIDKDTALSLSSHYGMGVKNIEKALYNPLYSIELMIRYIEELHVKYEGQTKYMLLAWNSGEPKADGWLKRERAGRLNIRYTYYKKHKKTLAELRNSVYRANQQKKGEVQWELD